MKKTWTTKEGNEIEISGMETSHILNTIKMLERKAADGFEYIISYGVVDGGDDPGDVVFVQGEEALNTFKEYAWLKEELATRKS